MTRDNSSGESENESGSDRSRSSSSSSSGSASGSGSARSKSPSPGRREASPKAAPTGSAPASPAHSSGSRSGSSSPASKVSKSSKSPDVTERASRSKSKSPSKSPAGSRSSSGSGSRSGSPSHSEGSKSSGSGDESPQRPKVVKEEVKSPDSPTPKSVEGPSKSPSKSPGSETSRKSKSKSKSPSPDSPRMVKPVNRSNKFGKSDDEEEESDEGAPMEIDEAPKGEGEEVVAEVVEPEEEPPPAETRIEVEIPKITTDLGKGIHFVKLPNFLSVDTRPFDPATYEDEIEEEELLDEEGRARCKLKVENTIRWRERHNEHGVFVKESNSRLVKWSDGSMSLHLGGEIFNVYKQPLQGDHNHLFIRQGTGLQGQAVFRSKLTFRPHSTDSFTHRKMTMSLADRSQKTSAVKIIGIVGKDPESERGSMLKKEEERLRASVRRESKQRRVREKAGGKGLSAAYLEDGSDDEGGISLSAIKNRFKKGGSGYGRPGADIYSSSDESAAEAPVEEDESSDIELKKKRKARFLKDSDEEGSGDEKKAGSEGGAAKRSEGSDDEDDKKSSHKSDSD